jgi:hypothetical protein
MVLLPPATVSAGAVVIHPGDVTCTFEPGDIPGLDVYLAARCTIVVAPSGAITIVVHGTLPAGFALPRTFVGIVPCFGGTGRLVATTSGEVAATCHLRA